MQTPSASTRYLLLGATMLFGAVGLARADSPPAGNPALIRGTIAQYVLTPHGNVAGLILTDGSEVRLPRHAETEIVFVVHPGDAVTIRGVRINAEASVVATSVTNDRSGLTVDTGEQGQAKALEDESRITLQLHDRESRLDGVLLEDGTVLRLPPAEAQRLATILGVGLPLAVRGEGRVSPLGKVIAAREIGPTKATLKPVDTSAFDRWMHEVFSHVSEPAAAAK